MCIIKCILIPFSIIHSSIPSRETTPQSEEPLREMDHLVVPETTDPHVHLFLNACSGCEDEEESDVFQANEIPTNLGKAGPNGILEVLKISNHSDIFSANKRDFA